MKINIHDLHNKYTISQLKYKHSVKIKNSERLITYQDLVSEQLNTKVIPLCVYNYTHQAVHIVHNKRAQLLSS